MCTAMTLLVAVVEDGQGGRQRVGDERSGCQQLCACVAQGRRQSLQKKPAQDDAPEEEGAHEKALMMRTRGPASSAAAQADDDNSRRPSRR